MDGLPINYLTAPVSLDIPETNTYTNAATLSFWAFVEDSTMFSDQTFSVNFERRIKIWVGSKTANQVGVWCIPLTNYYQYITDSGSKISLDNISTKTQLEAQKADTKKNVLFAELGSNKDSLWFNVRCSYSLNAKKNYLGLHQKDASGIVYDDQTMKMHSYIEGEEIDFPFRDFKEASSIKIDNGGNTSKAIYLKSISAFIDMINKPALYEYF